MLANGVEGEVYTAEEGLKLLDTVTAMIATVDAQLVRLRSANLKAEDQQALDQTRQLVALLQVQTSELRPTGRPARRTTRRNSSRAARRPGRGSRICWGSRSEGAVLTPGRMFFWCDCPLLTGVFSFLGEDFLLERQCQAGLASPFASRQPRGTG